jgi:hypothetical protein
MAEALSVCQRIMHVRILANWGLPALDTRYLMSWNKDSVANEIHN